MKVDRKLIERAHGIAVDAVHEAGTRIVAIRNEGDIGLASKGDRNPVTRADLEAEAIILSRIRDAFPEHRILSEESSPEVTGLDAEGPLWIVDPVDGTSNYAYGLAQVGVSVALAWDGEIQLGVVHAPFLNETFTAVRGGGAKCNDRPIRPSTTVRMIDSLVGTGFPYLRENIDPLVTRVHTMLAQCRDLRRLGAASLDICYVACGRLDAYYETVCTWDMAAGALIAREAGAIVGQSRDYSDGLYPPELDPREMLVAAPGVFDGIRELLKLD